MALNSRELARILDATAPEKRVLLRKKIASRFRLFRQACGWSQRDAARALGLHREAVAEIEAGRRKVTAEEIALLAEVSGHDANAILL